jgi:hypothetical protein
MLIMLMMILEFISALAVADSPATQAQAAFEHFKKIEGKWQGSSTKGWNEEINFKTIAQRSVVVEDAFGAHPNETMMSMIHLDRDRLLLTHYCVSRTQPRLQATGFEDNGRKITFTYLDGTNLSSRDQGHMDKAIFHFIDEDHILSRWTWYQNGRKIGWRKFSSFASIESRCYAFSRFRVK